jgi:hypothetical protein
MATGKEIWKIVEEFDREHKSGPRTEGPPWPDYNGGKQFCCTHCGAHFDTSVGKAWHEANDCIDLSRPHSMRADLPACPVCGSYSLYRLPGGGTECQTCGGAI